MDIRQKITDSDQDAVANNELLPVKTNFAVAKDALWNCCENAERVRKVEQGSESF